MSAEKPNDRQMAFARHYVDCLNATKAAALAGYSERTAAVKGCELRKDPRVKAEIDRLFDEQSMGAGEVKARLTDIARGSLEDFLTIQGDEDSEMVDFCFSKAKKANKLGLLRKLKITKRTLPGDAGGTETRIEIEIHDPQKALAMMGRHHHLLGNDADDLPEDDPDDNAAVPVSKEQIEIEAAL